MAKNTSFLPEDYLERRQARRTNLVCMVLFALVMGGVVGWYLISEVQRREVRQLQAQVNEEFEKAARRLQQLEELQARKDEMIQKARVTSVLVERVPRTLLLAELVNQMPLTLSLLEFDLETKVLRTAPRPLTAMQRERRKLNDKLKQEQSDIPPIEVPETEVLINLEGVAPTDVEVAQFMTSLSKHEMFQDVTLQFSEQVEIEKLEMRKFRIDMKLNPAINVQELEPTLVKRELKQNPMEENVTIPAPALVPATDTRN